MRSSLAAGVLLALAAALPHAAEAGQPLAEVSRIAALWNRPSTEGAVVEMLFPGATVALLDSARNERGLWWYVEADAGRGWLRDIDFPRSGRDERAQLSGRLLQTSRITSGAYCRRHTQYVTPVRALLDR